MEKVVKSVKQVGDFESQYGHFYKWLLEFEDGFKGEYLSKTETQNKFIELDLCLISYPFSFKSLLKVKIGN